MEWHHIILVFLWILLTQCSNHTVRCVITDVRLVGGPTSNKGTVEFRIDNGTWETTCGINLGIGDVIIICRQLGFTGANIVIPDTPYGQNSTPTRGLGCFGVETDLSECPLFPSANDCVDAGGASCHGERYLGCFRDQPDDRALPGDNLFPDPNMTISYCIQFCAESTTANYTHAGVEDASDCYCGEADDRYSRHGQVANAFCQTPCSGDPTESCGGSGHIAVFTIHVETSETTTTVGSTEKVTEVTSQPSSGMTSHTKNDVTSSSMTKPLSTPTTLPQSGHGSCVGVGVGEGVVIILLIATTIVLVMYILRNRRKQDSIHGQTTHDMTLVQASSSPDKDTGIYHDIQDIRTPVPSSPPAGGSPNSSKIYDHEHYSTRIEKN